MAIGWMVDLPDADDYFNDERFDPTAWDDVSDDDRKTRALLNAYNRIFYHPDLNVPASGSRQMCTLFVPRPLSRVATNTQFCVMSDVR